MNTVCQHCGKVTGTVAFDRGRDWTLLFLFIVAVASTATAAFTVADELRLRGQVSNYTSALANCDRQVKQMDAVVSKMTETESICAALPGFEHAISTIDKAIDLQKRGKLPPPEKP